MIQLLFRDGQLTELGPEYPIKPPNGDFYYVMTRIGWSILNSYPGHNDQDCATVEIDIFEFCRPDDADIAEPPGRYLALIRSGTADMDLFQIFCATSVDLLFWIRDWAMPLLRTNYSDLFINFLRRAEDCLFDEETGLPCAQREYHRKLRAATEAARRKRG
jgi:hypothetical protein